MCRCATLATKMAGYAGRAGASPTRRTTSRCSTPSWTISARQSRPTTSRSMNGVGAPDLSLMAKARAGFHGPYGLGINQLVKGMGGAEYIASLLDRLYRRGKGRGRHHPSTRTPPSRAVGSRWHRRFRTRTGRIRRWPRPTTVALHVRGCLGLPDVDGRAEDDGPQADSGFVGVLFLTMLSVLLYLTNKRIWAPHKGRKHG